MLPLFHHSESICTEEGLTIAAVFQTEKPRVMARGKPEILAKMNHETKIPVCLLGTMKYFKPAKQHPALETSGFALFLSTSHGAACHSLHHRLLPGRPFTQAWNLKTPRQKYSPKGPLVGLKIEIASSKIRLDSR